jgi:hypothetical protein
LLGINHFDPRHPEAVVRVLRQLQKKYGAGSAFAAVEAGKQLHETITRQKGAYRGLLAMSFDNGKCH